MKIILISPPQMFAKSRVAAGVNPPLGLMYLSASLRNNGYNPKIIDAVVEAPNNIFKIDNELSGRGLRFRDIISRIPKDAGLIGITNLFSFSYPLVRRLTYEIKKNFPEKKIVLGGAPIETVSEASIDFVIISEGDLTIVELAGNIDNSTVLSKIDGLAYKSENGKPVLNPKTRFIEDLDSVAFPDRNAVPIELYYEIGSPHGPCQGRWTPILSSRGCPFQCTFCTSNLWDRRYRVRSAKNVLDEIEQCKNEFNITEFLFEDENFTINKKRTLEVCNTIINKKLNIRWQTPNGIRASVTDEEMLDVMRKSGCHHITVAPESGSERVLNEIIKKQQDKDDVTRVVMYASRVGLKTAAYFVSGLPGETVDDVEMSIDYACTLAKEGLDEIAFSRFVPLPGSELYEKLVREGKFDGSWLKLTATDDLSLEESFSEHISTEELNRLRKKAYLRFYLTKVFYHPFKVFKSIINVLKKKGELKTERTLITMLKKYN
jgi:magnesium-protoporphyrin IX monomethyl ester (oxidative) cyclase